jgi:hypothetical protein
MRTVIRYTVVRGKATGDEMRLVHLKEPVEQDAWLLADLPFAARRLVRGALFCPPRLVPLQHLLAVYPHRPQSIWWDALFTDNLGDYYTISH